MKKYITIKGDTNDADYITSQNEITDEEIELIRPVVQAINDYDNNKTIKYQKWNWWTIYEDADRPAPQQLYVDTGKCSQEALDYFSDLCPHGEDGIHSIDSVEIITVLEKLL